MQTARMDELLKQARERWRRDVERGFQIGIWRWDPQRKSIVTVESLAAAPLMIRHDQPPEYAIRVDQLTTSASVLDWIAQLSHKNWVTNDDLGALVRVLNRLLGLQEHYCPQGIERGPVDVDVLLEVGP